VFKGLCHQQQFTGTILSVSYLSKGAPVFVKGRGCHGRMASPSLIRMQIKTVSQSREARFSAENAASPFGGRSPSGPTGVAYSAPQTS